MLIMLSQVTMTLSEQLSLSLVAMANAIIEGRQGEDAESAEEADKVEEADEAAE